MLSLIHIYHLYLRMVFFLGAGAVCLVAAKASDFAASERGHRTVSYTHLARLRESSDARFS